MDILSYARKWGVMNFCEHGLPYFHTDTFDVFGWRTEVGPMGECEVSKRDGFVRAEPLCLWRKLSRVAAAILNLGAELNQGRFGAEEDWRIASIEYMHGAQPDDGAHREMESKVSKSRGNGLEF